MGFLGSLTAPVLGGWLISTYSWPAAFAGVAALAIVGILALVPVAEPHEEAGHH